MSTQMQIDRLVDAVLQDYQLDRHIDKLEQLRNPDRDAVIDIIEKLRRIVFPGYFRDKNYRSYNSRNLLSALIEDTMLQLVKQIGLVYESSGMGTEEARQQAQQVTVHFFEAIPQVRAMVQTDLQAAYDGDPAEWRRSFLPTRGCLLLRCTVLPMCFIPLMCPCCPEL